MTIKDAPIPNEDELRWPQTPSAILIMGKRQGTKRANTQLWGRVAMAAALWYSAPLPKPYLVFIAADIHGPNQTPDAEVVKSMLTKIFDIPADFLILRQRSNCTLLEVRAARALSRAYRLTHIFVVTHLYHAMRTQRYFDEVMPNTSVIPVHSDILDEITFPAEYADLLPQMQNLIAQSQPKLFDATREHIIEWLLSQAHSLDPRGRFERRLARLLRPTAYWKISNICVDEIYDAQPGDVVKADFGVLGVVEVRFG